MGLEHTSPRVVRCAQVQEPKSKKWYATWAEAEDDVAHKGLKIDPTMFPPPATTGDDASESAEELHLERAMRFLPHHQDTGGFFVAVLEKVAECADMVVPTIAHRKRKPAAAVRATAPPRSLLRPAAPCRAYCIWCLHGLRAQGCYSVSVLRAFAHCCFTCATFAPRLR
jgi:hypothetical protein